MESLLEQIGSLIGDHLGIIGALLFGAVVWWRISVTNKKQAYAKKVLQKAIETQSNEPLTLHPEIDPNLCAGCGSCTTVCPEGDILKLVDHRAVLVKPTKCVGHGECERSCPMHAIKLVFGTKTRGMDIPRVSTNYETNVPGLYIAGELGGMGLIRNAIKQGVLSSQHALKNLKANVQAQYDLVIVGGGPAGLAAGLVGVVEKKKYIVLEQNSFGGTVYNFPRQKVVMTHPAELPLVGTMKFETNKVSKEELLAYWDGVRKKSGLAVQENTKFETLTKSGDLFTIKTNKGEITARKVILAMGVRGSPRKLGLPNEDLPKVTYNLLDPEQYQGQHVTVVGGGNAGVEAAQYLAKEKYKNNVTLLVRGASFDRCNDENKNIINALEKKGLVQIWFNSSIKEIHPDKIAVDKAGKTEIIPNHFLFIFAGAEMPHKFLMSLGVQIDKKFGEALDEKVG